ncbi:hypothetical protein [Nonomuraea typhae]|uniref:hypothetical protein n=1 Tax=Nonomuraea typhae TaxID=2603600 RepID=UPI0012F98014|nr:hypothetical protein [Nonomuraea typhae]
MIDHYRRLFARHQWLENALCWIVVQPPAGEPSLDDVLWRLNGGRAPEIADADRREAGLESDAVALILAEGDGAWGLLDCGDGYQPDLAALSSGSRAWMTTWHPRGGETLVYAAGGAIRASIRDFVFAEHPIETGDPAALEGFRRLLATAEPGDFTGMRAAAFAFIEASTGVGLDPGWLEEEGPVVFLTS